MAKNNARMDRSVDLLERLGAGLLYASGAFGQKDVAKVLAMDINRVNEILKGIKRPIN